MDEAEDEIIEAELIQPENMVGADGPMASSQVRGIGKIQTRQQFHDQNRTVVPMALTEPTWKQQKQETDEDYALFKVYLHCQIDAKKKRRSMAMFLEALGKPAQSYEMRIKAKIWSWEIRGQAYDRDQVTSVSEGYITQSLHRIERAKEATEELVALVAEKTRDLLKEGNHDKLMQFAPYATIVFGPGGTGKFLLESYKIFNVDAKNAGKPIELKIGSLQWKDL